MHKGVNDNETLDIRSIRNVRIVKYGDNRLVDTTVDTNFDWSARWHSERRWICQNTNIATGLVSRRILRHDAFWRMSLYK